VTWLRDGVPLSAMRGHVHMDTGDQFFTLTVLGTETSEAGRYECIVENSAGSARHVFDVNVSGLGLLVIIQSKV
jgi:hypothetical protein